MKIINCLLVFILLIGNCSAVEIIPKSKESYTCYDYSVEFREQNPDWGIVTISNNKYFYGISHMVNYQLMDDGTLKIHDGLYKYDYVYEGWERVDYYHFWGDDEIPKWNYRFLWDNREVIR